MNHPIIFPWDNLILKQTYRIIKSLPFIMMLVRAHHIGHLESVHAVMIRRAVCYSLPCVLDLSEGNIMKVPLEYRERKALLHITGSFFFCGCSCKSAVRKAQSPL